MNQYEVLYIIVLDLDEEATRASVDKFKGIVESNGGEVVAVDEWGKRKLAYTIDYKTGLAKLVGPYNLAGINPVMHGLEYHLPSGQCSVASMSLWNTRSVRARRQPHCRHHEMSTSGEASRCGQGPHTWS